MRPGCRFGFLLALMAMQVCGLLAVPLQDTLLRKGILPNGLTYYIYPNLVPSGEAVYRLFVKTGSLQETERQRGLAHVLEHMAFNGTRHFSKDRLVAFLESRGAKFGKDLNAHTSYEETVYKLQLPSSNPALVDSTLTILADWADGMELDSTEIEKERGVILSEWLNNRQAGEAGQEAFLSELLNHSHFAERKVIGDTAVIRHFSRAELLAYYRQWYQPARMAVAVVGDVDVAQVEALIAKKFGGLDGRQRKKPPFFKIASFDRATVNTVVDSSAQKAELNVIGLLEPEKPVLKESGYRAYLLRHLLNQLLKRRFSQWSFEGPAYMDGSAQVSDFLNAKGLMLATAGIDPAKAGASVNQFAAQLGQLRAFGFTSAEIGLVKDSYGQQLKRQLANARLRTSMTIMDDIYADFYRGQPLIPLDQEITWMERSIGHLDSIDFLKEWRRLYQPDRVHYLLTTYPSAAGNMPSAQQIRQAFDKSAGRNLGPYKFTLQASKQLLGQEPAAGRLLSEQIVEGLQAKEFILDNGVRVLLRKPVAADGRISISGFRRGGLYALPPEDYVTGLFAGPVVALSGAGTFGREGFSQFLNGKAVSARFLLDKTRTGVAGSAANADASLLLQLIYLKWTAPRLDTTVFEQTREKSMAAYRTQRETGPARFARELSYQVEGSDYTNRELTDTLIGRELRLDRILPVFNQGFGPASGFVFVVTSSLPESRLKPLLLRYLGGLPAGKPDTAYRFKGHQLLAKGLHFERHMGETPKASVSLIYQQNSVPEAGQLASLKADMLAAVLRMKLLKQLREEMGMVYNVSVSASATLFPAQLARKNIGFSCRPEDVQPLIDSTNAVLHRIATKPVSFEAELADVKANLLKEMALNRQKDSFWTAFIRNGLFNNDADWQFADRYADILQGITSQNIAALARSTMLDVPVLKAVLYPANDRNIANEHK